MTYISITEACKEAYVIALTVNCSTLPLKHIPYIYHLIWLKKDKVKIQALLNSGSKVNTMTPVYSAKLGLKVRLIDIGTQKINGPTFKTFGIVLASFQVNNKFSQFRFF